MPIRVILLEPESSGNIGAVARSMKNFALNELWIVNPKTPINHEARAFAMRGLDILSSAKITRTLSGALRNVDLVVGTSAVAATSRSNLSRVPITPSELAAKILGAKGTIGLLFGRESSGLSNQELTACDLMVTIPANRDYNVLNLATAASIVFYEIFSQKNPSRTRDLARKEATQALLVQFDRMVKRCVGQRHKYGISMRAFRNVISRSFITKREASLLLGVLRKANAKLT